MPRGQYKRVSSHNDKQELAQIEETQALSADVRLLLILAHRMADRCVRGKYGLALENDARAALDLWDALPEEFRKEHT